jgi:hypothetical protein
MVKADSSWQCIHIVGTAVVVRFNVKEFTILFIQIDIKPYSVFLRIFAGPGLLRYYCQPPDFALKDTFQDIAGSFLAIKFVNRQAVY